MAKTHKINVKQPDRGIHAVEVHHQTHASKRHPERTGFDVNPEVNKVIDLERLQAVEAKVVHDPRFTRLILAAVSLAEQRNRVLTGDEDPEKELELAQKKEDELAELFDWAKREGVDSLATDYIVTHAFALPSDEESLFEEPELIMGKPEVDVVIPKASQRWWDKGVKGVYVLFDASEWEARWRDPTDPALTTGVIDAMTERQAQKKKEHNRMLFMIGASALLDGTFGKAPVFLPDEPPVTPPQELLALEEESTVIPEVLAEPEVIEQPVVVETRQPVEEVPAPIEEVPEPIVEIQTVYTPPVVEPAPPVAPPDYFNIAEDEDGPELFSNIGLSEADWERYENELNDHFPFEFGRRASGHVEISHAGPLSEEARAFISNIPK